MKHILCDVDGVVIQGYHADPARRISWSANIYNDLGIRQNDLEQHFFLGPFTEALIGRKPLADVLADVLPRIGYKGSISDFITYWFQKDSRINNPFMAWVKSRKQEGDKVYLATNQEHMRANYLWNDLGFADIFDDIYYAAKIGFRKPEEGFFSHVINDIGVDSSSLILIDDCPKNVKAANARGIKSIQFNDMNDVIGHSFFE